MLALLDNRIAHIPRISDFPNTTRRVLVQPRALPTLCSISGVTLLCNFVPITRARRLETEATKRRANFHIRSIFHFKVFLQDAQLHIRIVSKLCCQ